jgi:MFS transporter, ACS family, tartrate transporter
VKPTTSAEDANANMEQRVLRKVTLRLMPFLCLCFMAAFVDRVNVGFAKLQMMPDLGMSQSVYATGAGVFFIGYFLFEVPSNLLLQRYGARFWLARIMVFWGLVSAAMLFVTGTWSFYTLRFLLGAAEAGFFPGVILYLTHWFPKAYRGRAVSLFMVSVLLSLAIANPLSGYLMAHPQFGFKGWQWLFLVEGLPSVLLGVILWFVLPNQPQDARWLKTEEANWLATRLQKERTLQERQEKLTLGAALRDRRVLLFSAIYFLSVVGGYGLDFFAPTLMARAFPELGTEALGQLLAIPPLVAIPIMILHGRSSDARQEQRWHVALAAFVFAAGLLLLALALPGVAFVAAMTLAVSARWCIVGPFWGLPTAILSGSAAAGGIALINSLGNLGGQAGPVILSRLSSPSGSFAAGLVVLAALAAACGALTLLAPRTAKP